MVTLADAERTIERDKAIKVLCDGDVIVQIPSNSKAWTEAADVARAYLDLVAKSKEREDAAGS